MTGIELARAVAFAAVLAACPASIGYAVAAIVAGAVFAARVDLPVAQIAVGGLLAVGAVWDPGAPAHLGVAGPRELAVGLVLLAGAVGIDPLRRLRIGAAAVALAVGVGLAARQLAIEPLLPGAASLTMPLIAMGWACAAAVCAAPTGRPAGIALAAAGAFQLVFWELAAPATLAEAIRRTAWRHDGRIVEAIERTAVDELAAGRPYAAMTAVDAYRTRGPVGEALARAYGPTLPLRLGWDPAAPIDSQIAADTAFALDERGERGRAIALLRRQPRVGAAAWALCVLAREAGDDALADEAFATATVPDDVIVDPSTVVVVPAWLNGGSAIVGFATTQPLAGLHIGARGTAWNGPPTLIVTLGGRSWSMDVHEEGGWIWPVDLPAGGYRLKVTYPNDGSGVDGDRNLYDVRVDVIAGRPDASDDG